MRTIHNPDGEMRVAQYKILKHLLDNVEIPSYICAFEKNRSIPGMARLHTNKKVVISVDIKDFFHSIKQHQVKEMFEELGIGSTAATTLSEVCTYKYFVPQGALTSPKIANMITARTFGPRIKRYCDQRPCLTLSIYADDVTISSTDPSTNAAEILTEVMNSIRDAGFRVNYEKTKVMWDNRRQYVCGVVVNKKTNMLRKDRLKLRGIVHNIVHHGLSEEATKSHMQPGEFASHVKGRLNWLKQLNRPLGVKYNDKLETYLATLSGITTTISNPVDGPVTHPTDSIHAMGAEVPF